VLRTTTTSTPTRTDAALIAVERGRVTGLRRSARLSPRILGRGPVVRAALVPAQAGPLDGDHDRIALHVGAHATLVLVPITATLALPGASRLDLGATVAEGGVLVLDEPPLIVAAGADIVRTIRIDLAPGAVALVRDIVVLGRAGEGPGRLDSTLRATLDGRPLLHDALRIEPAARDDHVALAPGHRVVGTACLLGERSQHGSPLAGPGALERASGPDLPAVEAALARPVGSAQRMPRRLSSSTRAAFAGVTNCGPVGISSPRAGISRCRARSASSTIGRYPCR
jgi:urease accessory protein